MELAEMWEYALTFASDSKAVYAIVGPLLKSREISKENLRKIKQALNDMDMQLASKEDRHVRDELLRLLQFI